MRIFVAVNTTCCTICGWLSPQMQNCGYGGPTLKLYADFSLQREWVPLTPMLFKGELYLISMYYVAYKRMLQYV